MPLKTITFNGKSYPELQSKGFAAKFAFPFAHEVIGEGKTGYDIGCNRKEWSFPGSIPIDPVIADCRYDAYHLPDMKVDYIYSSHCLEHLVDWVKALEYWHARLHVDGILFLYLPDMSTQSYWRPWHNRKHVTYLSPDIMQQYMSDMCAMWDNAIVTGYDLNNSFYVIAQKK